MLRGRMDGITIAAIAFFLFLLFNVVKDNLPDSPNISGSAVNMVVDTVQKGSKQPVLAGSQAEIAAQTSTEQSAQSNATGPSSYTDENGNTIFLPVPKPLNAAAGGNLPGAIKGKQAADVNSDPGDPNAWADPYPEYIVTQGPHGQSYGHYAVDITAGKGATIYSPINGIVTALFVDQYNNTNLIIENSRYQVLFLHGNYTVQVGQELKIGDPIGTEWNNGYTLDGNGNLCAGRDCGYHTHLNIFDKSINSNIDPFNLLSH